VTPHDLLANFETLAEAPNGIQRLRELVLELAVRGKLVEQDPRDEPAEVLLKKMRGQKLHPGKIGAQETPQPHPDAGEFPHPVPSTWLWVRLEQVAEYNGRSNVDPDEITPDEWVLDLEDIEKETSRILKRVSNGVRISKSTKSTFCKGDVLFGKLRPYLNKVIVADQGGVCTTEIVPIVPAPGLDSEYLRLLLKRPGFLKWVDQLTYGVKMPRLGTSDAKRSLHPLPPSNEQRRIVARVDELMALLDRLDAKRQEREAARTAARDSALAALREAPTPEDVETSWLRIQERFHELFATPEDVEPLRALVLEMAVRGKLVEQDAGDEPALKALESLKVGSLLEPLPRRRGRKPSAPSTQLDPEDDAEAPDSWEECRIGDLAFPVRGVTYSKPQARESAEAGYLPILRANNIGVGLNFDDLVFVPKELISKDQLLQLGDLVVCTSSGSANLVGKSARLTEPFKGSFGAFCAVLRPKCEWVGPFLDLLLHSPSVRSKFRGCWAGNGINNLRISDLEALRLFIPPIQEQRRIVARVDELMALLDRLSQTLESQSKLAAEFAAAAVHHLEA